MYINVTTMYIDVQQHHYIVTDLFVNVHICTIMSTDWQRCYINVSDVTMMCNMLQQYVIMYNYLQLCYDMTQQCTMTCNTMLQYSNTTTWCYDDVTRLLQHCYNDVTMTLEQCATVYVFVTMMVWWHYNSVQLWYNCVSPVVEHYPITFSMIVQCYTNVQQWITKFSMMIQPCTMLCNDVQSNITIVMLLLNVMQRTTTMCTCCTAMLSYCYNVITMSKQRYSSITQLLH